MSYTKSITVILTFSGATDSTQFNIYTDSDAYNTPVATNVVYSSLKNGYLIANVPRNASKVKVTIPGSCGLSPVDGIDILSNNPDIWSLNPYTWSGTTQIWGSINSIMPTPTITPSITPTNTITPTLTPTSTITPTVTKTPNATPTVTPTQTTTSTPTPTLTPTMTPSKSANPNTIPVITDGLRIYNDVSKTSSYSGSGNIWYNMVTGISGNAYATLTNFTYQSGNGGYLTSTGATANAQIAFGYPTSTVAASSGGMTFGGWFSPYFTGTTGTTFMRFASLDSSAANYSNGLYLSTATGGTPTNTSKGRVGGDNINFAKSGTNTDTYTNNGPILQSGNWYYIHYVWINNTSIQIYVNGVLAVTRTGIGVSLRTNTGGFNIGQQGTLNSKQSVSTFEFYNRALSGAEILSNFNATKTRFGY